MFRVQGVGLMTFWKVIRVTREGEISTCWASSSAKKVLETAEKVGSAQI